MALIAGLAVGFWLVMPSFRRGVPSGPGADGDVVLLVAFMVLGGLAVAGPPLLLAARWRGRERERGPWQGGKILWFATGTSAWLLWPPIVAKRLEIQGVGDTPTGICFAYGTPLMAVYVVAALFAGGWFRKSRRRRIRRSWHETFGLLLGLAWACTGLYVLANMYRAMWNK